MKDKKKMVPEIRFKGFEDDWEQRKLSEIATMNARIGWQNLRTSEFLDNGDYMLITGTDFKEGTIDYTNIHYVEKERYDQDKKIQIRNDSILITKDGTLGKVAYVEGLTMPATLNAGVFNVRVKEDTKVDSKYLFHYLKAPFLLKYADSQSTGGTIKHLNQNVLVNFPIPLPSEKEQKKIGSFFKQLDDTIALHQRKYDILKSMKQEMLQNLFPTGQSEVPEIRFTNFNKVWEQRMLKEISNKVTEKNKNNKFTETFTNSAEYGIISQREFFDKDISNKKNLNGYYIVRKDDFVYNPRISNYAPVGPIKRNKLGRTGIMSPLYYVFRTFDINQSFLEYYFETTGWHRFMKLNGDSGARADRFAIRNSIFETMSIPYPSFMEQENIGAFFNKFNEDITLRQRKITELTSLKKELLKRLFV